MKKLALILLITATSCKTTSECDAYVEEDIYKQHVENQKKYCSVETIK
jgi:hypothetical protein